MSAILGIHNHHQGQISSDEYHMLIEALHSYQIDTISSWMRDTTLLLCGEKRFLPDEYYQTMPYVDESSGLVITADVILDNREDLCDRLGVAPVRRSSISDCELILLSYQRWGADAPRYLIGDYAFVIWDQRKRSMFGARDHFGNRTLYYTRTSNRFAFSTAIRPLLRLQGVRGTIRESWLAQYLAIPIVLDSVDCGETAYEDIEQLPPAHRFTFVAGHLTVSRYTNIVLPEPLKLRTNGEYEEAFLDVFSQAVKSKLRTNRQIGAHLSGGLDSGSVVSLAARELKGVNRTLHTFSYIPPEDFVDWTSRGRLADERPYIHETVRHVGSNISDNYLNFPEKSSYTEIDDWLSLMEMPYKFAENSFWAKGICEEAARHDIGILLTGGRGNHTISWGSAVHYYAYLLKQFRFMRLNQELKQFGRIMGMGRKQLVPIVSKLAVPMLERFNSKASRSEEPQLIHPDFARSTKVFERLKSSDVGINGFSQDIRDERMRYFNVPSVSSMQGTVATKLSLRLGVLERDPTIDPRVVQFCLSVPLEQYVQQGMDRALIRRAMKDRLPDQIRLNQRIRGIQASDWVHRILPDWDRFVEELEAISRDSRVAGLLNQQQLLKSLGKVKGNLGAELAFDPDMRLLLRCIVIHRFLSNQTA